VDQLAQRFVTPEVFGEQASLPVKQVRTLLAAGKLPGRKFGHLWRVDLVQLEEQLRGTNLKD
jgi:hypothetical protein